MGWKDSKEDAANRGGFVGLKSDKEFVDLVAVSEPEKTTKPGYQGGDPRTVYRVLVVSLPVKADSRTRNLDLSVFSFNAYASTIGEGREGKAGFKYTRHGVAGDTNTRYTFKALSKLSPAAVKLCRKIAEECTAF